MTREEAIEKLNNAKGCPLLYDSHIEAIDMAIQALSQEPISLNDINNALEASFRNGVRSAKVEQEPCDDTVSIRKDVLKCRVGKLVVYNVEWLKKHWQMEMDIVCGVKPCEDGK